MNNIRTEDKVRLLDIADAIREILGYVGGADYKEFTASEDVRESVATQMTFIAEAAALLSDEFKEQYGDIDWDMLQSLQYAPHDEYLEMDHHGELYILQKNMPEMLNDILDVATMVEDEEDLDEVSLNDEDKQDIVSMQEDRKLNNSAAQPEEMNTEEEDMPRLEDFDEEDDGHINKRFGEEEEE